ncbi:unnamed protein product [Sphenostylis stenocarpa]|uniref:Uncharacterized protein n=1 Tax=Sphenostylis stenocarpa TaxID=92480 RepID=A0AA86V9F5_9FABA|nr:unnamed protein product [Sphenostylis stenocarpa]
MNTLIRKRRIMLNAATDNGNELVATVLDNLSLVKSTRNRVQSVFNFAIPNPWRADFV